MNAVDTEISEANLIPQNPSLWSESMLWDEQVRVYTGLGYNNNVLLSAFNPRGSGFFLNGLDAAVLRLPLDGWKVAGAVTGDDMRYWHSVGPANGEDLFLSSARVERDFSDGWQAGLETRGLYENQVLDTSTSSGVPTTALVQGFSIAGQPYLRKDLTPAFWLELDMPVARWLLRAPQDDYWNFGPAASAGYDFNTNTDVTLSYGYSYQLHDTWVALDKTGVRSLNKLLRTQQQQVELAWHQYWDHAHCWRSATRFIFVYKLDNGGGFFDLDQYQFVEDLRWQTSAWEIKGSSEVAYEYYPVQTDGVLGGPSLQRTLLNFTLDVQRRIFKELKCFAKVEYQRTISNEVNGSGSYNGTMGSGGLSFNF